MDAAAPVLLVIRRLADAARLIWWGAALLSPACAAVNASEHQAFWLWSGVKPTAEMHNAGVVYLHQGETIRRGSAIVFERVGLPVSPLSFSRIWLTVRVTTLNIPEATWSHVIRLTQRWQKAGIRIVWLQIDFDAATQRLADYGAFLTRLRAVLPAEYAPGVTGLLDRAKTGSVATLNSLPIDELVIQTYQGRKTVKNYADYLPALRALTIPWKIGLVQNGEWDSDQNAALQQSPWFRGTVIFMVNSP